MTISWMMKTSKSVLLDIHNDKMIQGTQFMNYETLLDEAVNNGLIVKEKPLKSSNGRINGNKIAIRQDIKTTVEKSCVLSEELGHHYTSVGNIIDMSDSKNRKQERQARLWGYNKLIGLTGIVNAYKRGCQDIPEMAEFLDVTEEYLKEAIDCYRDKYGVCTTIDNYTVFFIPYLTVMEKV